MQNFLLQRELSGSRTTPRPPASIKLDDIVDEAQELRDSVILGFTRCGTYLLAYVPPVLGKWPHTLQQWKLPVLPGQRATKMHVTRLFDNVAYMARVAAAHKAHVEGTMDFVLSMEMRITVAETTDQRFFIVHGVFAQDIDAAEATGDSVLNLLTVVLNPAALPNNVHCNAAHTALFADDAIAPLNPDTCLVALPPHTGEGRSSGQELGLVFPAGEVLICYRVWMKRDLQHLLHPAGEPSSDVSVEWPDNRQAAFKVLQAELATYGVTDEFAVPMSAFMDGLGVGDPDDEAAAVTPVRLMMASFVEKVLRVEVVAPGLSCSVVKLEELFAIIVQRHLVTPARLRDYSVAVMEMGESTGAKGAFVMCCLLASVQVQTRPERESFQIVRLIMHVGLHAYDGSCEIRCVMLPSSVRVTHLVGRPSEEEVAKWAVAEAEQARTVAAEAPPEERVHLLTNYNVVESGESLTGIRHPWLPLEVTGWEKNGRT